MARSRDRDNRGGSRTPSRPAAVSPPGSGRRTDGGPGDTQPIRLPSGGEHGERQQLEAQQRGAPLREGGGGVSGTVPSTPSTGPINVHAPNPFRPTERPRESPDHGTLPPESTPDVHNILAAAFDAFPHPYLLSLLQATQGRSVGESGEV